MRDHHHRLARGVAAHPVVEKLQGTGLRVIDALAARDRVSRRFRGPSGEAARKLDVDLGAMFTTPWADVDLSQTLVGCDGNVVDAGHLGCRRGGAAEVGA